MLEGTPPTVSSQHTSAHASPSLATSNGLAAGRVHIGSTEVRPRERLTEGSGSCRVHAQPWHLPLWEGSCTGQVSKNPMGVAPGRHSTAPSQSLGARALWVSPPLLASRPAQPSPGSGSARQVQTPGPQGEVWPSSVCRARWERAGETITITKSKAQTPRHGLALPSPESGSRGDLAQPQQPTALTRPGLSPWKPNKHDHPCPKPPAHPSDAL